MRGYAVVSPVGLTSQREGVGLGAGAALGLYRTHRRFGAALGLRFGYGLTPRLRDAPGYREHALAAGPELRLGLALPRVFAFVLARGGYSHQLYRGGPDFRTSILDPGKGGHGGHVGGGLGAWGRLGRRLLIGGEVAVDAVQIGGREWQPRASVLLTLGAWL
ncbi:hypothetical protein [Nannocystis punicea]|uniref:Outer membrane protein beta-barrel domain-containing protein n=1 Tax=Nannocystis punicea TaxID=2995304 RepID=A0ABY7HAK3_9BACT|nr:hypothetical protein [Nannocystis poenicansa]WAS96241.1 hypothetical protein O0S08_08760 [Nannocystis poenicansa]